MSTVRGQTVKRQVSACRENPVNYNPRFFERTRAFVDWPAWRQDCLPRHALWTDDIPEQKGVAEKQFCQLGLYLNKNSARSATGLARMPVRMDVGSFLLYRIKMLDGEGATDNGL